MDVSRENFQLLITSECQLSYKKCYTVLRISYYLLLISILCASSKDILKYNQNNLIIFTNILYMGHG